MLYKSSRLPRMSAGAAVATSMGADRAASQAAGGTKEISQI